MLSLVEKTFFFFFSYSSFYYIIKTLNFIKGLINYVPNVLLVLNYLTKILYTNNPNYHHLGNEC